MVSKRARATNTVGTRLSAVQEGIAALEARTRTPAPDTADARLGAVERNLELLNSPNYRADQEQSIWDGRYTAFGVTAERIARYGIPGSDAERVALANRRIVWYNSELGWEESYYAVTGTSGLTVPGLVADAAPGWYPIGTGPRLVLQTAGAQAMTANANFTNWNLPGTGYSYRLGPAGQFVDHGAPGYAFTYLAGRYEVMLALYVQNGTGTGVASLRANHSLSTAYQAQQKPMPLLQNYGQVFEFHMRDLEMKAGGLFFAKLDAGSISVGGGWTELSVKYLGPPLVQA